MNSQPHSTPPPAEDLDTTAELPVLDIAAMEARAAAEDRTGSTDTWIIPPPTLRVAPDVPESSNAASRNELETNFRALSANLGDVEDRLKRKVEQLTANEIALEAARTERAALELRAGQIEQQLLELRATHAVSQASLVSTQHSLQEHVTLVESLRARDQEVTQNLRKREQELAQTLSTREAEVSETLRSREQQVSETLRKREQDDSARAAEHQRVMAALRRELDETQTLATGYLESLQTREGQRNLFDNLFSGLLSEVDAGESQVARLSLEISSHVTRGRDLDTELAQRAQRIAQLESQINTFSTSLAQREEQLKSEGSAGVESRRSIAALEAQLAAAADRFHTLESTGAERIKTLEVANSERVRDLESAVAERARALEAASAERDEFRSRVSKLELALAAAMTARDEHEQNAKLALNMATEQETASTAQRRKAEQLENELAAVRAEMAEWSTVVRQATAERTEHTALVAAREERIKELDARVAEQQETVRALQADSNVSIARAKEVEADLRVAEEAIHRLETEVRGKSVRVDELEKTNHDWHAKVSEARVALTERESLIQRLEEEAANSAVLIGQIQQSMKRLDPAASGSHEAMPEGATRLLVRMDGESEVVHVLGRKTTVGRTPDNDLQIDAKFISRHHAVILAGPARTIVEDLNSTNGVLVNGRRVSRQVLQDGDAVIIGRTQFRFVLRTPSERR